MAGEDGEGLATQLISVLVAEHLSATGAATAAATAAACIRPWTLDASNEHSSSSAGSALVPSLHAVSATCILVNKPLFRLRLVLPGGVAEDLAAALQQGCGSYFKVRVVAGKPDTRKRGEWWRMPACRGWHLWVARAGSPCLAAALLPSLTRPCPVSTITSVPLFISLFSGGRQALLPGLGAAAASRGGGSCRCGGQHLGCLCWLAGLHGPV